MRAVTDHVTFSTQVCILQGHRVETLTHLRCASTYKPFMTEPREITLIVFNPCRTDLFAPRLGYHPFSSVHGF
jgi:hypothetical protein